jgi:NarL family two-component system response regulator LiaR
VDSAIRVLIADDHPVVRIGLKSLIASEPDMEVVGEAIDDISAVAQARAHRPDVVLMGLAMSGMQGVQVIEELSATAPEVRVLVLTRFNDDEHVFPALRAGARGYLLKEASPEDLLQGIRDVAGGRSALHCAVARRVLQGLFQPAPMAATVDLTDREADVLALVAQGRPNKAIATQLNLSERTVRSHVSRILMKLHLSSRTQAALYALRTGRAQLDGVG